MLPYRSRWISSPALLPPFSSRLSLVSARAHHCRAYDPHRHEYIFGRYGVSYTLIILFLPDVLLLGGIKVFIRGA
jgi:hypothetical protein